MVLTQALKAYSAAIALCLAVLVSSNALAQSGYPHRVVTLVTHSSPGGGSDVFLRELARFLGPEMGVEFVVENVRGGSGARAMAQLANAPADGSLFYATTPTYIYTSLLSRPANTYRDLEPLVNVFFDEEVVYTRTSGPFETLEQVIEKARTSRGRWGASTPASLERQALEQLKLAAGVTPAIVTHEGGGDLMLNVLNGTLDIGVGEAQEIRSQLDAGQLKILAVFAPEQTERLPGIPTVKELGYDVVLTKFRGIAGPPGTPPAIVDAWQQGVQRVLENPDYRNVYEARLLAPRYIGHAQYGEFIDDFATRTQEFLRATGVLQ
ncbi:MAG: tripartite tricarboxylate transporter substrate binding protein [Gammaproteobacteria bacterium]|nr:tripartite tricarboxylate transporter substrate binding protein [Gammaproteobacteria bacterium]